MRPYHVACLENGVWHSLGDYSSAEIAANVALGADLAGLVAIWWGW